MRYASGMGMLLLSALAFSEPSSAQQTATSLLEKVTECDVLAAHPDDLTRMAEGIGDDKIVPRLAIPACEQALARDGREPRFLFQLGRAMAAGDRKDEAFALFARADQAGHPAASGYLGDAHQTGAGTPVDLEKALGSYRKASAAGFTAANAQIEQMTFDASLFTFDVLGTLFQRNLGELNRLSNADDLKAVTRTYVFAMTQRLVSECTRVLSPPSIISLYRYRFGENAIGDAAEAQVNVAMQSPIGEYDANIFVRRHGCDGPVARHVFAGLDEFFRSRPLQEASK